MILVANKADLESERVVSVNCGKIHAFPSIGGALIVDLFPLAGVFS